MSTVIVRFHATPKDKARLDRLLDETESPSLSELLRRLIRAEYERLVLVPSSGTKDAISERIRL